MAIANEIGKVAPWPRERSLQISAQAMDPGGSNAGTSWVVHAAGTVDWTTSRKLRADINELIQSVRPERVIMDLEGVTRLDSAGIGALVAALRDARQNHVGFLLAALNTTIRRLLERTQLHTVFDIRPTVQDALRA